MRNPADIVWWQWPDFDTAWFLAFWLLLVAFAFVEAAFPAFDGAPQRHARWTTNLGLGIVNMVVSPIIPISEVIGAEWARQNGVGLLNALHANWWIIFAATVLVRTLATYLLHILTHKIPFLWRFHRIHHCDTHLDVSTTIRTHPVEFVFMLLLLVPVAVAFGLDPVVLAGVQVFELSFALFNHANIRLPERWDRILRWLIVTPNMHSLHHSSYQPETDSNYGGAVSIWDRIFGTHSAAPKNGYGGLKLGLKNIDSDQASDIVWQLKSPALEIKRARPAPNETVT
jgi:sterol desaturase/sphingolipid hydroxylase (fatty acid hydroxylase superfamily)